VARVHVPARVTVVQRVRSGGTGDVQGPGALVAVGRADGRLTLYDGRDLTELVTWETPSHAAVHCVDVSPCTGYLVAGCANGIVAVFALPALPATLPVDVEGEKDESLLGSMLVSAVNVGAAALSQVEKAQQAAKAAKGIAGEVKGFFGSMFGGRGKQ
jgi:hypothetical protein